MPHIDMLCQKEIQSDDYGFDEEKLCSLGEFMKTHPPKQKEPER